SVHSNHNSRSLIVIFSQPQHATQHRVQTGTGNVPLVGGMCRACRPPSAQLLTSATPQRGSTSCPQGVQVTTCWAPAPQYRTRAVSSVLKLPRERRPAGPLASRPMTCQNASLKERVVLATSQECTLSLGKSRETPRRRCTWS